MLDVPEREELAKSGAEGQVQGSAGLAAVVPSEQHGGRKGSAAGHDTQP